MYPLTTSLIIYNPSTLASLQPISRTTTSPLRPPTIPINRSKYSLTRSKTPSTMPPPEILSITPTRLSLPTFSYSSQLACSWMIEKPGSERRTPTRLGPISRHTSPWPIANFAKLTPPQPVADSPPPTLPRASFYISPILFTYKRRSRPLKILHPPPPTIASPLPPSPPPLLLSPTSLLPPTPN